MARRKYTPTEIAEWMKDEVTTEGYLSQEHVVSAIEGYAGIRGYTYQNRNGNRAISPAILKEFRRLTEGRVVWSRSELAWRKQRTRKGRRVVD